MSAINLQQDISRLTPKEAGDLYRRTRDLRLQMQKETEEVESFEKRLKAHVIDNVAVEDGFVVGGYVFAVTGRDKPTIKDWDVYTTGLVTPKGRLFDRFDTLQKRLSDKAVMDTEDWKTLPGIGYFTHKDISVTKR